MNTISIIGLGWLGLPLYKHLNSLNFTCKGSTTSLNKQEQFLLENIDSHLVELKETKVDGSIDMCLKNSDILILNTPPGLRKNPDSNYVAKIKQLLPYIIKSEVKKVLFVSSTSVFKDELHFPKIKNDTSPNATSNAAKQLKAVEELLTNNVNFETTILRFSGLVNDERHPARMMSKRSIVQNGEAPVNLIHQMDCIGIITAIIQQNQWQKTFNSSFPKHPSKKRYYEDVCSRLKLSPPNFDTETHSKGKLIDGEATSEALNYTYKYVV